MDEKAIVEKLGEEAWKVCNDIMKVVKSLRATNSRAGVKTGARLVQYEVAIKHAMGKSMIPWEAGQFLLKGLDERTIQAILRINGTEPDKINVWLL